MVDKEVVGVKLFQVGFRSIGYSHYLTVKYMLFDKGSGLRGKLLAMLKIIFSMGSIFLNYKRTMRIIKIEFDVRAVAKRSYKLP